MLANEIYAGAANPARTLLLLIVFLLPLLAPISSAADSDAVCKGEPIVVKIHADWCRTCKAVDSVWRQLRGDMGDRVNFVELDVSDRVAFQTSRETAQKLGLDEFFREYRSKTGTIAILDCNSLEPVAVLNGERDPGKYREAIARASHSS